MTVAVEQPPNTSEPILGRDVLLAAFSLAIGLAFNLLGIWLFGTPFSFSIFFVLGPVVLFTQTPIDRGFLFDASVATLSVTLVAFILNAIGSLVVVFPFGYQVFCAITAVSFFGMLYGWRRFGATRRVVGALSAFDSIPKRVSRPNHFRTPNGFGPWLGACVTVSTLIAIIDFGFPAASSALCGVAVAIYAFLLRWPLVVFDASLASLASLLACVLMSSLHVPFTVNALIAIIITYIVTVRWRELPYATRAAARITKFLNGDRSKREPPPVEL